MSFVSIIATCQTTGVTVSRNFATENEFLLKSMVESWEKETVNFRRYALSTTDCSEEFNDSVLDVLEKLFVTFNS